MQSYLCRLFLAFGFLNFAILLLLLIILGWTLVYRNSDDTELCLFDAMEIRTSPEQEQ